MVHVGRRARGELALAALVVAQWVVVGVVAADEGGSVARAVFLAPLTVVLVYALARRLLGRRLAALAGALWVSGPWLALSLFDSRVDPFLREDVVPAALALSEWRRPAWTLALLLAALLPFRRLVFPVVLGVALADVAGGAHDVGRLWDQYQGLQEYFWTAPLFLWIPVAGIVGVARRSPRGAALVGLWAFAFLGVAGTNETLGFADATLLLALVPAFPALVTLAAALPLLVPRRR